jgi:hypothetical protein
MRTDRYRFNDSDFRFSRRPADLWVHGLTNTDTRNLELGHPYFPGIHNGRALRYPNRPAGISFPINLPKAAQSVAFLFWRGGEARFKSEQTLKENFQYCFIGSYRGPWTVHNTAEIRRPNVFG